MLDPDKSDPAGSGSEPDPHHLDQKPDPDPNLNYYREQEKNYGTLSAPQMEETGTTVYPIL